MLVKDKMSAGRQYIHHHEALLECPSAQHVLFIVFDPPLLSFRWFSSDNNLNANGAPTAALMRVSTVDHLQ
jgi:hypothetical protein